MADPAISRPGRFRWALTGLSVAGLGVVFASSLVGSALWHVNQDLAPTRRVAAAITNGILAPLFQGELVIGSIERLDLHGVRVGAVAARYPSAGRGDVLRVRGLDAHANVLGIVKSALLGVGPMEITIASVDIEAIDVTLDAGRDGAPPPIAALWQPRTPSPPSPPGRGVRFSLAELHIGHIGVTGDIAPELDAELEDLDATVLVVAGDDVNVDVDVAPTTRLAARGPSPIPIEGTTSFHFGLRPSKLPGTAKDPKPADITLLTTFSGLAGKAPASINGQLLITPAGMHVTGDVNVPVLAPEVLRETLGSLVPGLPLHRDVSLTALVDGDVPTFAFQTTLEVFNDEDDGVLGQVFLDGVLDAGPRELLLDAELTARNVDPEAFQPFDESMLVDTDARYRVRVKPGSLPDFMVDMRTSPTSINHQAITATRVHATKSADVWVGILEVDEPGAPTSASFAYVEGAGARFEASSDVLSLREVKRFPSPVDAAVHARVTGTLLQPEDDRSLVALIKRGRLDARVRGGFSGVRAPGAASLRSGTIDGSVHGTLDAINDIAVDASVTGDEVKASGYSFKKVTARAKGPIRGLKLETHLDAGGGESIHASAGLDIAGKGARDVKLTVKRGGLEINGKVARVGAGPRGVAISGLTLEGEGVGNVRGGLEIRGKEIVGKLHAEAVDLAKLVKLAGIPLPVKGIKGLADIDVELEPARGGRKGHVQIQLEDAGIEGFGGVSALLSATFDGDRLRTNDLVRVVAHATEYARPGDKPEDRCEGTIAHIRVSGGDGVLEGALLDPRTWIKLHGRVDVADEVDLRCLARLAPVEMFLSEIRGKLATSFSVERAPGQRFLTVREASLREPLLQSRGLVLAGPLDDKGKPEWASRDLDFQVRGSLDGKTGESRLSLSLVDENGTLVRASVGAPQLDLPRLVDKPDDRWAYLRGTPIRASLVLPRRSLAAFKSLPSVVTSRIPPLVGDVQLDVRFDGTLDKPALKLAFKGFGVAQGQAAGSIGPAPLALPIDLDVSGGYDGEAAKLEAHVTHESREIVTVNADAKASLRGALEGRAPELTSGALAVKFDDVPLGSLPLLMDREIAGKLRGTIAVGGLPRAPSVDVDLSIPELRVGGDVRFDQAIVGLHVTPPVDGKSAASAKLQLVGKDGGHLDATAALGVLWSGLSPDVDYQRPGKVDLTAKRFRLAALHPAVAGALSRLEGFLDGTAHLGWQHLSADGDTSGKQDDANVKVKLKVTQGVFHLTALGQEFHDGTISINSGLNGWIGLDELRADGIRGRLTGSGGARLRGLALQRAQLKLEIKPSDALPVTLQGAPLGDASGVVDVEVKKLPKELAVDVKIPLFELRLAGTPRGVQSLEDRPDFHVSHAIAPPKEKVVEGGPRSKTSIVIKLGKIGIRGNAFDIGLIRGGSFDVGLTSVPKAPIRVDIDETVRVSGDIRIEQGRFTLQKAQFKFEDNTGLVHLRPEEPGNPYVNVHASAELGEDVVNLEYVGLVSPLNPKTFKLSSPTIPDSQIIGALLSGSAGQASAGVGGVTQGSAGQLLIANQLNTQLSNNLATNFKTGDDGTIRPGLAYTSDDGSRTIELSTYEGSAGSAGDTAASKGQHTTVTIDWRVGKKWSVRGHVDVGAGQTNSGLDLLWLWRY